MTAKEEILYMELMDEYYDQFKTVEAIIVMEYHLGKSFAFEMLKNRNGSKILIIDTGEKGEDITPDFVYE